mmetsp:Transcript_28323/g.53118  ORF Transcript_28323/g.53118 Transcript_28323/m.53118 type:complete len:234 (-) Transcript_28323:3085-3786(-)
MSVKLFFSFATDEVISNLRAADVIETGLAVVRDVLVSALAGFLPASTAAAVGTSLVVASPPQPAPPPAFFASFTDPLLTQIVIIALLTTLSIELCIGSSADPEYCNLATVDLLENRTTFWIIGVTTDLIPPSSFVCADRLSNRPVLPQIAKGVVHSRKGGLANPELTERVLGAHLTACRIEVLIHVQAFLFSSISTDTAFVYFWSTSVCERRKALLGSVVATLSPPSTAIGIL